MVDFGRFYSLSEFATQATAGQEQATNDGVQMDEGCAVQLVEFADANIPIYQKFKGTSYGLEEDDTEMSAAPAFDH